MRNSEKAKMLLSLGLLMLVATSLGCFKIDMDVTLKPDLGMEVGVEIAAPLEMAENMEIEAFGGFAGMENVKVEDTDTMRIVSGTATVGPAEQLGPEEEAKMQMMRQKVAHRLSTHYVFVVELPAAEQAAPEQEESGDEDTADEEEIDAEGMAALMAGMMSSLKIGVTVHMPGRIVATSGTRIDDNTVLFDMSLQDFTSDAPTQLTAVSRLPNYTNLGRLADQMIAAGADADVAGRLAEHLNWGLLPDPPVQTDPEYKLSAGDYRELAELIAVLDEQLTPGMTEAIITNLGLNKDRVNPAQIQKAKQAAEAADLKNMAVATILEAMK